jgi:hypothetical protein
VAGPRLDYPVSLGLSGQSLERGPLRFRGQTFQSLLPLQPNELDQGFEHSFALGAAGDVFEEPGNLGPARLAGERMPRQPLGLNLSGLPSGQPPELLARNMQHFTFSWKKSLGLRFRQLQNKSLYRVLLEEEKGKA